MFINKKFVKAILFCCVGFIGVTLADNPAPLTAAATKPVLNIQHWQTQKGARVYFVATPELPMVDVQVVFDAGSAREDAKFGLAQLTAGLLNEGTKTLTADQIGEQFDAVGAIYGANVNRDMTTVGFRSMVNGQYLHPALNTFISVLTTPDFNQQAVDRVKKQMLNNLQQQQQQPAEVAQKAFFKALYGDQPYAHSEDGTPETVAAFTREDVQKFYQQFYTVKNAMIVIVGDVDKTTAQQMAEQIAQPLPEGMVLAPLAMEKPTSQPVSQNINFPSQQTTIVMGQVGITPNDPDYYTLKVGNNILGGTPLTSRLFIQVREQRGLAYGATSNFTPLAARGPFVVFLQTRNEKAQEATTVTQQVVQNFVQQGPTVAEVSAAKDNIIGQFPFATASNAAITAQVMRIGFYHLPLDYLDTFRDKIKLVSLEQIRAAFNKQIQPNNFATIMVGPAPPATPVVSKPAAVTALPITRKTI